MNSPYAAAGIQPRAKAVRQDASSGNSGQRRLGGTSTAEERTKRLEQNRSNPQSGPRTSEPFRLAEGIVPGNALLERAAENEARGRAPARQLDLREDGPSNRVTSLRNANGGHQDRSRLMQTPAPKTPLASRMNGRAPPRPPQRSGNSSQAFGVRPPNRLGAKKVSQEKDGKPIEISDNESNPADDGAHAPVDDAEFDSAKADAPPSKTARSRTKRKASCSEDSDQSIAPADDQIVHKSSGPREKARLKTWSSVAGSVLDSGNDHAEGDDVDGPRSHAGSGAAKRKPRRIPAESESPQKPMTKETRGGRKSVNTADSSIQIDSSEEDAVPEAERRTRQEATDREMAITLTGEGSHPRAARNNFFRLSDVDSPKERRVPSGKQKRGVIDDDQPTLDDLALARKRSRLGSGNQVKSSVAKQGQITVAPQFELQSFSISQIMRAPSTYTMFSFSTHLIVGPGEVDAAQYLTVRYDDIKGGTMVSTAFPFFSSPPLKFCPFQTDEQSDTFALHLKVKKTLLPNICDRFPSFSKSKLPVLLSVRQILNFPLSSQMTSLARRLTYISSFPKKPSALLGWACKTA